MSQYLLSSNRPWSLRCAGRHYSMYNCKQHITCPGHRGDHGPPLTPLSCKQSATDKHLTRNPLSSQQPQSAPVCAMSTVISLLFYSKQHERWSRSWWARHMWHMPWGGGGQILCQKTWRELRWWYQQVTGCEAVWEAHYQTGNARSKLRQNYLGASLTKLNINISPR